MKRIIFVLVLLLPILLFSVTRTVSLDGTQQYTSIQTAIDASSNGDIVEVYPGEYFEHLNTSGRSITIRSRYYITLSDGTINSTIIHSAPQYPCLIVNTQESVTLNGFTLMNNYPVNLGVNLYGSGVWGGGMYVTNNSSIQILNCVIKNCIGRASGGVYFQGLNFYMSNTKIFDNYGVDTAGGITIWGTGANSIVFDSLSLNSIYNNTSSQGMDISVIEYDNSIQINLLTFSTILYEPDDFFFKSLRNGAITINVLSAYFSLINQDLYVSPIGDNTNSGLTPNSPLQTIAQAVKIVESDSSNPKTIHLAPGVYNFTDSNQYFPFTMKSHTRLIGDNVENTIFDSEQTLRSYFGLYNQNDIWVENITFEPYISQSPPISFSNIDHIVFRNLIFEGTFGAPRIMMFYTSNIICENIVFSNAIIEDDNYAFRITYCDNVILNNIFINDLDILGTMANVIGFSFFEADVVLRNSIISNCSGYDVSVLFYQNIGADQSSYNLDMSNMLIFNNQSTGSNLWSKSPVYLSNRYQRMKINNCTVANNNGVNTNVLLVKGDSDINNTIIYNPGNFYDVFFSNVYDTYTHYPTINYSLIRAPYGASNVSLVDTCNVMIDTNPLFLGTTNPIYDLTMPEYYQLSVGSPCINAGTPDTLGLCIPPMDLAGNYRVWNGRIDMGCYEYGSDPYVSNENPEYPPLPDKIMLSTYPNPVYLNGSKGAYTFIEFTLPEKAKEPPLVEIYNIKGQKIRSIRLTQSYNDLVHKAGLSKDVKTKGIFYSTVWNCRSNNNKLLSTGTYIIRVSADENTVSKKITVIK